MCTNFVTRKTTGMEHLANQLGVNFQNLLFGADIGPGATISIVVGSEQDNEIRKATWWLYLQQTDKGLRPHRDYFSVNTRYDKLDKKPEYRKHRCIIPATAFVESQDGRNPHLLEPVDGRAIAFGGLWKTWTDKVTGEVINSASIITLPGHPSLKDIHRKSVPMWLPESAYGDWLDPENQNTGQFEALLKPALQVDLRATPIDKARSKKPIGEPLLIAASL